MTPAASLVGEGVSAAGKGAATRTSRAETVSAARVNMGGGD